MIVGRFYLRGWRGVGVEVCMGGVRVCSVPLSGAASPHVTAVREVGTSWL